MQNLKKIGNVLSLGLFVVVYLISAMATVGFAFDVYGNSMLFAIRLQENLFTVITTVIILLVNVIFLAWIMRQAVKRKKNYLTLSLLLILLFIEINIVIYLVGWSEPPDLL
jgi:hypothetical protein